MAESEREHSFEVLGLAPGASSVGLVPSVTPAGGGALLRDTF
jgi:hypothetical protein